MLGVALWDKQMEVLNAVQRERRVAVKSGNGLGKDFTAAVAVLWYLYCHDPGIVLSTAPTFRQVRHVLWRQIHALHRRAKDTLGGRLLDTRWELAEDRYALGLSADGADQFQGFHSENVLVVVDEAEGVDEEIYEAIDSVMTSGNSTLLLIGNPTTTSGPFYRAFHEESGIYTTITISALESPNVRAGSVEVAGLTTAEWVAERRIVWGEDSDLFRARVLGQFPERGEDTLISMRDIQAAVYEPTGDAFTEINRMNRMNGMPGFDPEVASETGQSPDGSAGADDHSPPPEREGRFQAADPFGMFQPMMSRALGRAAGPVVIGVDIARFGSDRTVVLVRRGDTVESIRTFSRLDTMASVGQVMAAIREHSPDRVNVDSIGIGAGVVDRLRELGMRVSAINVAMKPKRDPTCANLRAEGYQSLVRRFRDRRIRIPNDAGLISELASLRYGYDSRGRLLLIGKRNLRSRGIKSPDKADALMLAFLDEGPEEPYP